MSSEDQVAVSDHQNALTRPLQRDHVAWCSQQGRWHAHAALRQGIILLETILRGGVSASVHQDQQALLCWRSHWERRQRTKQHNVDAARDQVDLETPNPARALGAVQLP